MARQYTSPLGNLLAKLASLQAEEKTLRERLAGIDITSATMTTRGDMSDCNNVTRPDARSQAHENHNDDGEESDEAILLHEYVQPPTKTASHLPDEILIQILTHVSRQHTAQQSLAACCLLSHQWYHACVPLLYHRPRLYGKSFDAFVRAICPSINQHVCPSPLAELVRVLDLSRLVHQASKSVTARLLGRTKDVLEEFVAPQASFGVNCFAPLSKCRNLRKLDLSLVTESPPLPELFKAITNLSSLTNFRMPRAAGFGIHHRPLSFPWPSNLQSLTLSGGIDAHFLHGVVAFPATLRHLTIEHCPLAKGFAVTHLLKTAVRPLENLESIKISHMQRLGGHALDDVLFLLPQIKRLSVGVDYVTPALFDEGHFHHIKDPLPTVAEDERSLEPLRHENLRTLELTFSGTTSNIEDKISPIDIIIAIDDGTLPALRRVRVAQSLHWYDSSTAADTEALVDALQEASLKDVDEKREVDAQREEKAGVWIFEG